MSFFRCVDSEIKAYWLGFFYADGHIYGSGKQISIQLARKDRTHLKKFAAVFSSSVTDGETYDDRTEKTYQWSRCVVSSKELVADILRTGMPQDKSQTPPKGLLAKIPTDLKRHFIRGFFDGDGYVGNVGGSWRVTLVGLLPFLRSIRAEVVSTLALRKPKISKAGEIYSLSWYSGFQLRRMRSWLYTDASVFLARKKKVFDSLSDSNAASPYKGVYRSRKKWAARMRDSTGRWKYIGSYTTQEEAALAVDQFIDVEHGSKKPKNFCVWEPYIE